VQRGKGMLYHVVQPRPSTAASMRKGWDRRGEGLTGAMSVDEIVRLTETVRDL